MGEGLSIKLIESFKLQEKLVEDLRLQMANDKRMIAEQESCMLQLDTQHTKALEKLQQDVSCLSIAPIQNGV